jgi:hypothetical protein
LFLEKQESKEKQSVPICATAIGSLSGETPSAFMTGKP